jgi:hypothetical protein
MGAMSLENVTGAGARSAAASGSSDSSTGKAREDTFMLDSLLSSAELIDSQSIGQERASQRQDKAGRGDSRLPQLKAAAA